MSINKNEKKTGANIFYRLAQRIEADNDIQLIHRLEQAIGIKLRQRNFEEILISNQWGYALAGYYGHAVVGLNLDKIKLGSSAALLSGFRHLERLSLYRCELPDISFLQELNQLTQLNLTFNQITDISFLQGLSQLTELNLSYNQIIDISFLQGLSQLTQLSLRNNQITDISCLQGLNHLKTLNLCYNKITQLPEVLLQWRLKIDSFKNYELGDRIYIYGNPLEKPPLEIIRKIFLNVPYSHKKNA